MRTEIEKTVSSMVSQIIRDWKRGYMALVEYNLDKAIDELAYYACHLPKDSELQPTTEYYQLLGVLVIARRKLRNKLTPDLNILYDARDQFMSSALA